MLWTTNRQRRQQLEAAWQQGGGPRHRDLRLIGRFDAAIRAEPAYQRLDDQTWADLDGDQVFALLDATASRAGQQCLYHRLRRPLADAAALAAFDAAATYAADHPEPRGRALLALSYLNSTEAYYLPDLFGGEALPDLPWARAAPALAALLLATVAAGFWQPALWLLAGALVLGYTLLHFMYRGRIAGIIRPVLQLGALHRAGHGLARVGGPLAGPAGSLAAPLAGLATVVNRVRFLQAEGSLQSDMAAPVWLLLQYLKMALLLDFIVYQRCRRGVQQHAADIRAVFEAVGYADCALATASFRRRYPHCRPALRPAGAALHVTDAYHPLVPACVPNSLTLGGPGVLLTGSNMAGKTTFMRTLGLCAWLSQTLATCPATAYAAPPLRVLASLNLADSLPAGKSYYQAEAEAVLRLLQAVEADPGHYLLLLDELFKSTNTAERIAATQAVLAYLQPRSLVVASTHDGELGPLLRPAYAEYHFSEAATAAGGWEFDYRLKPGPLTTRNALRLLARAGYPAEVVRAAQHQLAALEA